jgi:hypothetical protein
LACSFSFGIDQNVIDKDHYEFIKLCHEYRVHKIHEVGCSICETKGHHQILVETISGGESSFMNVTRSNFVLVITRLKIDLGENLGSSQLSKRTSMQGRGYLFLMVTSLTGL